jgi:hypothetical protein
MTDINNTDTFESTNIVNEETHETHETHTRQNKKRGSKKQNKKENSQEFTFEEKVELLNGENQYFQHTELKEERKINDSASNSSMDPTRTFFSEAATENAKTVQRQIGELHYDASEYANKLILTLRNFDRMRHTIDSRVNNFFRGVFSLLGYNYHTDIEKINFFIFATQSWLLEVTKVVERKIEEYILEGKKFTFRNLLNVLQSSDISEEAFLNNLNILTSSSFNENCYASAVIENNVGKLFLNNLLTQLREGQSDLTEDIDNKKFETILSNILKKTVEATLNTMENQFDPVSGRHIPYAILYDDKLSIDEYFHRVRDTQKDLNPINLYSLKICSESFFYFSKCQIDDLIKDINFFTKNYSSIIFKTKMFVGKNLIENGRIFYPFSKVFGMVDTTSQNLNNLRKEKIKEFYELAGKIRNEIKDTKQLKNLTNLGQSVILTAENYSGYIYNSYLIPLLENSKERVIHLQHFGKTLINYPIGAALILKEHSEKYIHLPKLMTVAYTMRDFISRQWELSKKDYLNLKAKVTTYLNEKYDHLFVKIKPILFIEKDGEATFRFSINKNLWFINPQMFLDLYHYINNYVMATKDVLVEKYNDIKGNGVRLFIATKEYCMERYKTFLSLPEEKKVN